MPLHGAELSSVAVIGPAARQTMVDANRQERSRGFSERDAINPLQVLQALAPAGSHFTYSPGIDWIGSVVPVPALAPGLTRTESDSSATRTDPTLDYEPSSPTNDLKPGVTYTWTGTLTVPVADTYYLWLQQAWLDPLISFTGPTLTVTIDGAAQPLFTPGVPVSTYPPGVVPAAVAQANPNTIVVLNNGDPVLLPWLSSVKAVLEMWYPGQEGGTSTAKLLLGQANPGGRLPITWPASGDQTPFAGHPERINGNGTNVLFSEGLYMGYRWYDQQNITPLFAFGHGLSYTQFAYSGLKIRSDSGGLEVSFRVENTGSVRGSEVPQVYVGPPSNPPAGVQFALQKLVGFQRVQLNAGEDESVSVHVSRRELSYWSTAAQNWVLAGGERTISVGASSRDLRLRGSARVENENDQGNEDDQGEDEN